jgi:type II secretory pathway pseudopilin PulG
MSSYFWSWAIGNRSWVKARFRPTSNPLPCSRSHHPSPITHHPSSFGFTSIELIVVIIALSILAGTAVVSFRFSDQDKSTIAADQLIADIQYVQMRAMGIGNSQNIQFTNGSSSYNVSGEQKNLPDGVTVNNNNFNNTLKFNSLGEPFYDTSSNCSLVGNCSITLRDNVIIMVYAITGKTCLYDTANSRCF